MQPAERTPDTRVYAGFLRRVAAYLVDSLVLLIPSGLISFAVAPHDGWAALLQLVTWWIYKAGMESSGMQATLGKRALGVKVTDLGGERVSFARASGRFLGSLLSALILGIGYLMAAFTHRKQALHDMMASCLVVRASATPEEIRAGSGTMPMTFGAWVGAAVVLFIPLLGILAAIAIPAYQDYTVRAKMAEAFAEANQWRARAASEFDAYRQNPAASAGPVLEASGTSPYVSRVVVRRPERRLELVLDRSRLGGSLEPGAALQFTMGADAGSWTCSSVGVPRRLLPVSCRR